jgi:1,4-alpha-glucan branching enzyme
MPKLKERPRVTKKASPMKSIYHDVSRFGEEDIYLFKEGNHFRLYDKLGSYEMQRDGVPGVYFAVWAPNAQSVSVIGDFNGWNNQSHFLKARWDSSGIWEGFIPNLASGAIYKYHIVSHHNDFQADKADPFAFFAEIPPCTASKVWTTEYKWQDNSWMKNRAAKNSAQAPVSIYEVHLGSWRRVPEENNRSLTYREHANYLVDYVKKMGFTHVQLMPIMEHPFYGSWGYQCLGYFAPTSRYGNPEDLMFLIDSFHQEGIGVILDWVPSHFPGDGHGLAYFDGTHLYEHSDPQKGFHPDWKSYIFNFGRAEVKEFLISSALYWFEKYHIDGIRVDAVASMLYLDYSRNAGEWIPNIYGGRENIEAIQFLKQLNEVVYQRFPDVQMIAEESTAWGGVSRPTDHGGLGFGMKWNMGWMHDTLEYFKKEPVFRQFHHSELTFSMLYAYTENFVLSLSHDEVVHGKGSIFGRMPGDGWQRWANLRLLYAYMFAHPGKKLLFMGNEFGQWGEWKHDGSLDWHVMQYSQHRGIQLLVGDLNAVMSREPALHQLDFEWSGFEWIDHGDWQSSILSFIRKGSSPKDTILAVCNFTPVVRHHYRVGAPAGGYWQEILNSDAQNYGGVNIGNFGGAEAQNIPWHGREFSLSLTLPPLGVVYLKRK